MNNRRDFISLITKMGLGVTVMPVLGAPIKTRAEHVIYVYLNGGLSHVDSFDPKTDIGVKGPFDGIETVIPGVRLNQHLKGLAANMDKMAIVRSMSVKTGAHEAAEYLARTSYSKIGTIVHPGLGSWVAASKPDLNGALPDAIAINPPANYPGAGWMNKKFAPLGISDPSKGLDNAALKDAAQFNQRVDILNNLNKITKAGSNSAANEYVEFYDSTVKLLNSKDLEIFDLTKENKETRDRFGQDRFGQGCLLARRLVQLGKVRWTEISYGSFDTHYDNFSQLEKKLPIVDQGITALMNDLKVNGLLEKTLIVIATEFGRTPDLSADMGAYTGRNHWPQAYSCALIGAGIKGGSIYGRTDDKGEKVVENKVSVEDFNATIASAAGIDLTKQLISPEGRPFTPANLGKPIKEILV